MHLIFFYIFIVNYLLPTPYMYICVSVKNFSTPLYLDF